MTAGALAIPRDVRRIAFLRPGAVGDFVFSLPALHALKREFPAAEILYLGRPWHAGFLARRPGPVDRVIVTPPLPGIGLPPDAATDGHVRQRFIDELRRQEIDIAIQAYGGGRYSNPLVAALGARCTIGLRAPDAPALDGCIGFAPLQNRRLQLLELVALVGASHYRVEPEMQVTAADQQEAARWLGEVGNAPLVVLQPGASDTRRRWSASRFGAVGDLLAGRGMAVAVNGTPEEATVVREVLAAMEHRAIDLCGRLSLGGLCGLLEHAALLVSNDTGPLHLAVALGTPAVGIYWFSNLVESLPLRQSLHRAALSRRLDCEVCGAQNRTQRCPHDPSFVDDVATDEVIQLSLELLAESKRVSGPPSMRPACSRSSRRA